MVDLQKIRKQRQSGSASIEYIVLSAMIISTLFLPIPPFDISLVDWFLDTLRAFQANSTYLLSLP